MLKSHEQYEQELKWAYASFYSANGICPYFKQCSAGMEKPKIRCDFATRVGVNYGNGRYPKVLMLGLEGTHGHTTFEEPCRSLDGTSRRHYPGTLYTLAMILKREQPRSCSQEDLRIYEELLTHYALTNYYKCAFSDDHDKVKGLKHNKSMRDNCFKLLLKELDVLEPDLLIVQGKFTTQSFWNALDQTYDKGFRVWGNKTAQTDTISLYQHELNEKSFYILYSYHPASQLWSPTLNDFKAAIEHFCHAYDLRSI